MKISTLIETLKKASFTGNPEEEITGITIDSREVQEGMAFVAIKGEKDNGEDYIDKAIELGAKLIISEKSVSNDSVNWLRVNDCREALAKLSSIYTGNPSTELRMIGVTGTNGKTTISYMIHHILETVQHRAGIIGTIKSFDGVEEFVSEYTTPEAPQLNYFLRNIADNGCKSAVMEVSSHGIKQKRVAEIEFDVLAFSNLSQDHLDFHGNMDNYYKAKRQWFVDAAERSTKSKAVINIDDAWGAKLAKEFSSKLRVLTYGQGVHADYRFTNIRQSVHGSEFELQAKGKSYLVRIPQIGKFNIYNAVSAIVSAVASGISARNAIQAMAEMKQVPGRVELVERKMGVSVFVDYAHTPDAIENVGKALRELDPKRIITVFGCGGDRDTSKRPHMAKAAGLVSDYCIITSDNPRSEDPLKIIADIEAGLVGCPFKSIPDREEAINNAISVATGGDIVLIAGKGHEDYQIFADETIPFDDRIKARYALREFKIPNRNKVDEEDGFNKSPRPPREDRGERSDRGDRGDRENRGFREDRSERSPRPPRQDRDSRD
ncbi:UDP-N-acetylmuramoyl-L-alanyl-D-glutamate--2,6-diaminopimelate ligase [Akkermansiaceae bacterium]|nr:UDP-N-acetylmuramoyl-L-alanyl-D-glutamate--2,6-diaminopimelate ligase [Akkermansiaceae bacterium]